MTKVVEARLRISAQNNTKPGLDDAAKHLEAFRRRQRQMDRRALAQANRQDGLVRQAERQRQQTALIAAQRQEARVEREVLRRQRAAAITQRASSAYGPAGGLAFAAGGVASRFLAPAAAGLAGAAAVQRFAGVERTMTRTGLKFGVGKDQMGSMRREIERTASAYARPVAQVTDGLDALAETGRDFKDSMELLAPITKASQAMGALEGDIVSTFDAGSKSMGVLTSEAERFFDIIAAGGNMGKFEGSDLARYLPSLLPVVGRQGYSGLEGTAKLVGLLEVMRDSVGTSEEASTAVADLFEKISSPEVIGKFQDFGVDLEGALRTARSEGKDVLAVLRDIMLEVTKGDRTLLSQLFGDRDSRRAADLLLTQWDRVVHAQQELLTNSGGTVEMNVQVVLTDTQAAIDKMGNAWDRFVHIAGARLSTGVTPVLESLTEGLDQGRAVEAAIAREEAVGGSEREARLEYYRRYEERNPAPSFLNPIDRARWVNDRDASFRRDGADYGNGLIPNWYANLDEGSAGKTVGPSSSPIVLPNGRVAFFRPEETRQNIDDLDTLRTGVPVPSIRDAGTGGSLSVAEQYRLYGEGRAAGEQASAGRHRLPGESPAKREARLDAASRGEIDDGMSTWHAKNAAYAGRSGPNDPWFTVPGIGLRVGPFTPDDASREAADARWEEIQAANEALRQTMADGGVIITDAGTSAGTSISTAGQEASVTIADAVVAMAGAIEAAINSGGAGLAASISAALAKGVRVNGASGAGVNANLGQTMPNAGTPGQ